MLTLSMSGVGEELGWQGLGAKAGLARAAIEAVLPVCHC